MRENGLWFEDGNIQQLAAQIQRILTDDELRHQLIANGKKAAFTEFSLDRTLTEYEQFFEPVGKKQRKVKPVTQPPHP
jgi:glycosyltransferase involved in cell wall biosynthesis